MTVGTGLKCMGVSVALSQFFASKTSEKYVYNPPCQSHLRVPFPARTLDICPLSRTLFLLLFVSLTLINLIITVHNHQTPP